MHDQEIEVRRIPPLRAEEESENREAKEPGTISSRAAAEKHERAVQFFKRGWLVPNLIT